MALFLMKNCISFVILTTANEGTMKTTTEKQNKKIQAATDITYFSISCLRLLVFTVLSLNLYPVYLEYKNWQAVKKDGNQPKIMPFFRSWLFGILFIIPLFLRMRKSFKNKLNNLLVFDISSTIYLITMLAAIVIHYLMIKEFDFALFKIFMLMQLAKIFLLLPIQYTINKYDRTINPEHRPHKSFFVGEIITLLLAMTLFGYSYTVTSKFAIRNFYRNFDRPTRNIIINKYIFEQGYPKICSEFGYKMKNYQPTFRQIYQTELKILDNKLKEKNINYDQALKIGGKHFAKIIHRQLRKELFTLSQEMFANTKSTQAQNMYRFCSFMDMSADIVIKAQLQNKELSK